MVGDRLTVVNADPLNLPPIFNGTFRVLAKTRNAAQTSGTVCFENTNAVGATIPFSVSAATWTPGAKGNDPDLAELTIGTHPFVVNDTIDVTGVISTGPGSFNGTGLVVLSTTSTSVAYDLATDPGTYTSGGEILYPTPTTASVNTWVLSAGWYQKPGVYSAQCTGTTATLTLSRAGGDEFMGGTHNIRAGDSINVIGVSPAQYNGNFTVDAVTPGQVVYTLDPCPAAGGGGTIEYVGSVKSIVTAESDGTTATLTFDTNSNAAILDMTAAGAGLWDGDIVWIYGAAPAKYNGRWMVTAVSPTTVTVGCPPANIASTSLPACNFPAADGGPVSVTGGLVQSSGTLREVVFESRGQGNTDGNFLSDFTHGLTNRDVDNDGWMNGPCELCHTSTANHLNYVYRNTATANHKENLTCTVACHTHSTGFDKDAAFCPTGRTCPPVNP
jgi:hypothetical protein